MPISSKAWPLTLIKRLIISIVSKNHSLQYSCTVEVLPRLALNSTTTAWQMTHSLQNCPELNKSKQLEKGCSVVDSLLWQVKNDPIYASNPIILIFQSHQYTIHRDFSSCGPNRSFWSFFVAPKQRCKTVILWRLWRTMVQRCEGFSIRLLSPRSCCIIFIYTTFCIRLSKSLFVFCPNTINSDFWWCIQIY